MSEHGEPASPEAERAVLGSILLDSSKLPAASAIVRPDDFVEEVDQRIFRKVLELADRGAAVDLVTLKDALNGTGRGP